MSWHLNVLLKEYVVMENYPLCVVLLHEEEQDKRKDKAQREYTCWNSKGTAYW